METSSPTVTSAQGRLIKQNDIALQSRSPNLTSQSGRRINFTLAQVTTNNKLFGHCVACKEKTMLKTPSFSLLSTIPSVP